MRGQFSSLVVKVMVVFSFVACCAAHPLEAADQFKYFPSDGLCLKIASDGSYYLYSYQNGVADWAHPLQQWDPSSNLLKQWKYSDGYTTVRLRTIYDNFRKTLWTNPSTNRKIEEFETSRTFYKGANLPWIDYGHDIGSRFSDRGFSVGDTEGHLITALNKFSGGAVRVFLFTDLKDIVDFSGSSLAFYDRDKLYRDMDTLLEAAAVSGTKLMPVLFDYWLAFGSASGDTGHPEVFTDSAKNRQLMDLMASFIDHYKNRSEILMWDLMNEPYYGTSASPGGNGRGTRSSVSADAMRTFLRGLLATVRANDPGKNITIGFENKENISQYWSSFVDGGADDVDVIQIHYWAQNYGNSFSQLDFPAASSIFRGKPVIIGEIDPGYFNTQGPDPNAGERLNTLFRNGYMGGLFWQDATLNITASDLQLIQNWFYGAHTTYYNDPSNLIESKTLSTPDAGGNVYYHYTNENWNGRGYGRLDKQIRATADSDNARGYYYEYYTGTETLKKKICYASADYTNPSNPVMTTITRTYYYDTSGRITQKESYYQDAANRFESKTLSTPDSGGNVYYHYTNENWNGRGYGRLDKQIRATADSDNARGYYYEYYTGTETLKKKICYASADYTNPSNPVMSTVTRTYYYDTSGRITQKESYYQDAANRFESKTLSTPDSGGNVYYHYTNENWNGRGYGRLDKQIRANKDKDGAVGYQYVYYPGTNNVQIKYCYANASYADPSNPSLWNLVRTYYYSMNGSIQKTTSYNSVVTQTASASELTARLGVQAAQSAQTTPNGNYTYSGQLLTSSSTLNSDMLPKK